MKQMSAEQETGNSPLHAYAVLATASLCWAANSIFGRLAVGEISPLLLVSFRWLGVLLLLLVFARRFVVQDWPVLRTRLPYIALMGASGFALFNSVFYVAAHSTTAINLGILQGAMPVFVVLGMFAVYRVQVTRIQTLGIIVTIVGVVIVGSAGSLARLAALEFKLGDLLMLAACVLYAGYTVGLRRRPEVSSLGFFTAMVAVSFAVSVPLTVTEAMLGQLQWPTAKGWMIIPMVVLFPSFLAQVCFLKGVTLIGPSRAGVFINLVPIFAAILAVVFLRESFEAFHGVALLLVFCGIWLSEHGKEQQK